MKIFNLIALLFLVVSCSNAVGQSVQGGVPDNNGDDGGNNDNLNRERVYRFAVISDLNKSYGSTTYDQPTKDAVKFINDPVNKIDFVIGTGDMVAGQKKGLDYKAMWEAFHNTVTRPLKRNNIALYPSPGNHDASTGSSFAVERKEYKDTWLAEEMLPINTEFKLVEGVEHDFPYSYAFTIGGALFVALDATAVGPLSEEDVEWLEDVLEIHKDKKNKFIYSHVPLLPFSFKKDREYLARGSLSFLQKMEKLLEDYKVSVFFSGHHHAYYPGQRTGLTQFISVPLLGSGPRYLLQKSGPQTRSPNGFLIVEYSETKAFEMKSLKTKDMSEVLDRSLPESISVPTSNSSLCKGCKSFPKSFFLDQNKRILFQRRSTPHSTPN